MEITSTTAATIRLNHNGNMFISKSPARIQKIDIMLVIITIFLQIAFEKKNPVFDSQYWMEYVKY